MSATCCCSKAARLVTIQTRRARRDALTRAPRRQHVILASMNQSFTFDYQMPSGVAGESFFCAGASSSCQPSGTTWRLSGAGEAQLVAPLMTTGNGDGNGGSRPGAGLSGDDDQDGHVSVADQLSGLPLVVAVAFCAALYPALEFLAPPAVVAAVMEPQPMAAVEPAVEQLTLATIKRAIDAFLLDADSDGGAATAQAPKSKLFVHMG